MIPEAVVLIGEDLAHALRGAVWRRAHILTLTGQEILGALESGKSIEVAR